MMGERRLPRAGLFHELRKNLPADIAAGFLDRHIHLRGKIRHIPSFDPQGHTQLIAYLRRVRGVSLRLLAAYPVHHVAGCEFYVQLSSK